MEESMFGRLRTSRLWQVVLVLVLAGSAYGVYGWVSGGSGSAETATTRTVAVQYGSIVTSVSTSGSLVFTHTERLTFGLEGTVAEINAEVGDTVAAGQVLAKLDSASLASLESAVLQAEIALVRAEDILENPYSELDMAKAELAVVNARIAVETAYDNLNCPPSCDIAVAGSLDEYEACNLDWEQAYKELEVAYATRDEAEETLAEMQGGGDIMEAELRELEVASAQAAYDEAVERLQRATMTAPFNGIVASVGVEPGEGVNPNTVVIELVDPSVVEMSAVVDEIDIAQVNPGQRATISVDALPDVELSGEVATVPPFGEVRSGVVSYSVTISVVAPSGVQLLEGMSAIADIVVYEVNDILLVPNEAIEGSMSGRGIVMVMVNDQPEARMVTLGESDYQWTEVVEGLQEGDLVIIELATEGEAPEDSFPVPPSGFPGGGIPGGGRPGGL